MKKINVDLPMVQGLVIQLINILNIQRMPTAAEVKQSNLTGLDGYISRVGGYKTVAKSMGLELKTNRVFMSEDDIEKKILDCVSQLNITHMPSTNQIIDFDNGKFVTHNKITRSGGYRLWADRLNLPYNQSETQLGQDNEMIAVNMLRERGYGVDKMSTGFSYDLLVNKCIKIDAKSGKAYHLRGSRCHTFGINKKPQTCDLYMIFALSESGKQERLFIIPSHEITVETLSIGKNSKYNEYIDRWDLIKQYDNFYKNII